MREFEKSNKLEGVSYDVRGPVLEEAERMQEEGISILKLNTGNPAPFGFEAPNEVIRDLIMNARDSEGYSDSKGIFSARKAIEQYCQLKHFPNVTINDIYTGNGVSELITMCMQGLLDNGDEVLVPMPDYPLWTASIALAGGTPVHYICDEEAEWYPDIDDITSKITSRTKAIVIINPNNPTGQIIPLEAIEKVLKSALDKNIVVIVDEAYGDYMNENNSAVNLVPKYENLIVTKTFSKAYGLAGLRGGYIIQNEDLTKAMKNINTPYEMSSITRVIASKVVSDHDFLEKMRKTNSEMKSQLIKEYQNLNICENGTTVSIMMVTHKNKDIDLEKEFAKLKIGVISCASFESVDKNSVRFRLPSPKYLSRIIEAFNIIDNLK